MGIMEKKMETIGILRFIAFVFGGILWYSIGFRGLGFRGLGV